MGMAASQARYLGITARKINVEFEGQQVNQQRTALANESAGLFRRLLSLEVPTAPSQSDFYTDEYTFDDPTSADGKATVSGITENQGSDPRTYTVQITNKETVQQYGSTKNQNVSVVPSGTESGKYEILDKEFNSIAEYESIRLIAWSMGVWAAGMTFMGKEFNWENKIAINGTTKLIDDDFGIPKKIYKVTAKLLDENSKDKFIKNMFDNGKINPNIKITRPISELKEELISIQNIKLQDEIVFDCAIISNDDKIIPTKNQLNFWQNKTKIKEINSTHCPFEIFNSWQDLLC